ncbi:hypothetical protein F6X40_11350 [Paraburkholderia sp. UCT31]|uniref:hypothetical protein n=1 Tax=Paraburkholderia sp. UCT31 TaxID=2615209 RepID=UPI001654F3C1|nr:hypothetical protein [Paraburkholderia sp. UCT31]MBC8737400.1 hypothetical protein [Paraburkholderia sp. UCT31]
MTTTYEIENTCDVSLEGPSNPEVSRRSKERKSEHNLLGPNFEEASRQFFAAVHARVKAQMN